MKARKLVKDGNHYNIVWFGSSGKDGEDKKIPQDNYSLNQHGVADSLTVRLNVIQGELWYEPSYGLPLMSKIKSKGIYDSIIIKIILDHPDVKNIESFTSTLTDHVYTYDCVINTVYDESVRIIG